jgi:hypothetical protein
MDKHKHLLMLNRLVPISLLVVLSTGVCAQTVEGPKPKELVASSANQPSPALRYRLLPLGSELNPGDAAPIYLRIRHELRDGSWDQLGEKTGAWLAASLEKFPVQEARKFLNDWTYRTKLLDIGARREYCDWSFTLPEQKLDAIGILLPDVQSMRQWGRLLALKARVESAEHACDEAVSTVETGIALGRHVGEGPFMINALVGISICQTMFERLDELIAQPQAPNLYWALTALPRPLVSTRKGMESEQRLIDNMFPELAQTDESHSSAEWQVLLERLYARIQAMGLKLVANDPESFARFKPQLEVGLASYNREALQPSQEYLKSRNYTAAQVTQMSHDEVIARALAGQYRDNRDDLYKGCYLPWPDARHQIAEAEPRLKSAQTGPLAVFAQLLPAQAVGACLDAEVRLDRRVAALRVIEALRLYASTHLDKLPEALSAVKEVPVPDDPATGKPFEYRRDGEAALLSAPALAVTVPIVSYRITIRSRVTKPAP